MTLTHAIKLNTSFSSYADTIDTVILAAGKSTRFKQPITKILAPICGKPMLEYQLAAFKKLQLNVLLVLGHQVDAIKRQLFSGCSSRHLQFMIQKEQCGTGHALLCALEKFTKSHVLVINGDIPDISVQALHDFIVQHIESKAEITLAIATTENPFSYGRVKRENAVVQIIEEKNCNDVEKQIQTINAGIYLFKRNLLDPLFQIIKTDEKTGELFLPDLINAAAAKEIPVSIFEFPFETIRGINTIEEAIDFEAKKQIEIINYWIRQGVYFIKPETTIIDENCRLAPDSIIHPGVIIKNNSHLGEQVQIGPYSIIDQSIIGAGSEIYAHSMIKASRIAPLSKVGPFAHIHTETELEEQVVIGNFVEIKKSHIKKNSKVKHLSYIGDALIGKEVNIGAGTITCNFDGKLKHQTIIHDEVSIGANNALVAPITIERGAITAAGSTLTKNVAAYELAIARAFQVNKPEYLLNKKKKSLKENELLQTFSTTEKQITP